MKRFLLLLAAAVTLYACSGKSGAKADYAVRLLQDCRQLGTVEYTIKTIFGSDDSEERWYKIGERKVLYSCTAYIKAGVDLSGIGPEDIVISEGGKNISISLPQPVILSVDIPAESIKEEFYHVDRFRSDFSAREKQELTVRAQKEIERRVLETDILKEATSNAETVVGLMFGALGYAGTEVIFK